MSKKNLFNKKFSKSVLSFTRRIESFFNFIKENFSYKKNFLKSLKKVDKKIFISLGVIVFTIFSYFLTPLFYDKIKIKNQLETQILNQYNLKVKFEKHLKYGLLPKPHFYSNNTLIKFENKDVASSKKTKIFISMKNLFSSNYIVIKNLSFKQTNFKIRNPDFKFFIDLLNNSKSDQSIDFANSKFFYLDKNEDIVFLIDFKSLYYSYQEKFLNNMKSKLKIFDIPITLKISNNFLNKNLFTEINSYPLRLKVQNNLNYNDKKLKGQLNFQLINNLKKIDYIFKDNSIRFTAGDEKFSTDVNIKPFYVSSNLKFNRIDLRKLFKENSIIINILKSEILNNKNLNGKIDITIKDVKDLNSIKKIKFSINLEEGSIYINNLVTTFKNSVKIIMNDIQLIVENNKLKFAGYISLDFIDISDFYVHYQINRNYRKNIKKIDFGFLLNLDDKFIEIDNLKVNENTNQNLEKFLNQFNLQKQDIFNRIVFRNSVKNFLKNF